MTGLALKEPGVNAYPVSDEARQRIKDAKKRAFIFEARRILSGGGFRSTEVEAILSAISPFLGTEREIDPDAVKRALVSAQFRIKEAELIASALATHQR